MAEQVTLAAIAGAHGISGEVRLKLFAEGVDSLKRHKTFQAGARVLTLKAVKPGSAGAIARFAEVADRSAAEATDGEATPADEASNDGESADAPAEGSDEAAPAEGAEKAE